MIYLFYSEAFPCTITWSEIESTGLPQCDVVVNVCGENAFKPFFIKPYNEQYKKDISDSRIGVNRRLSEAIDKSKTKPKLFMSASAVGIYATPSNEVLNEASQLPTAMKDAFMVSLVHDWEKSGEDVGRDHSCRVACMRIGLVLGVDGGMFQQMKWQYFFGKVLDAINSLILPQSVSGGQFFAANLFIISSHFSHFLK